MGMRWNGMWHMLEGIWGNFKRQIEKFKIPAALLLYCSAAPLLYWYGVWVVFVAATFKVAKNRRLSDLRLHSSRLHASRKKSPLPLFRKEVFFVRKCLIYPPL